MAVINIIKNNNLQNSEYFSEDISSQIDVTKKIYSTSYFYKTGTLEVYINGLLMKPSGDFSEIINTKSFILNIPDSIFAKVLHEYSTLIIKYTKA
jgi:hypothetical protein